MPTIIHPDKEIEKSNNTWKLIPEVFILFHKNSSCSMKTKTRKMVKITNK